MPAWLVKTRRYFQLCQFHRQFLFLSIQKETPQVLHAGMSFWVGHRRLAEILRKWPKVCLSDQPSGPMISPSDRHKNVRFKEGMIENQSKHEPVCTLLKIGLSSLCRLCKR